MISSGKNKKRYIKPEIKTFEMEKVLFDFISKLGEFVFEAIIKPYSKCIEVNEDLFLAMAISLFGLLTNANAQVLCFDPGLIELPDIVNIQIIDPPPAYIGYLDEDPTATGPAYFPYILISNPIPPTS